MFIGWFESLIDQLLMVKLNLWRVEVVSVVFFRCVSADSFFLEKSQKNYAFRTSIHLQSDQAPCWIESLIEEMSVARYSLECVKRIFAVFVLLLLNFFRKKARTSLSIGFSPAWRPDCCWKIHWKLNSRNFLTAATIFHFLASSKLAPNFF